MAQEPFILCENLVKIYRVANLEVVALQGLDLIVTRGEMLGVVGASGSGKTTLMNILGGLDRPSAGRVLVDGRDLRKIPESALDAYRRSAVGFVWQQSSRNLVPYLSALENVELPMTFSGEMPRRKRRRAEELLEAVGLGQRRHHHLTEMSGGEQQRTAIAVALANGPKLLLGDEPTGEVDTATSLSIFQTLRDLNRQFNLTMLIVSHDPSIAHHMDRVVAIRDGKTSSETVRQAMTAAAGEGNGEAGEAVTVAFEELVVLDSAGRLQVPKEYLEEFEIKGRVRLERTEEGILIRPVAESSVAASAEAPASEPVAETVKRKGLLSFFRRSRKDSDVAK